MSSFYLERVGDRHGNLSQSQSLAGLQGTQIKPLECGTEFRAGQFESCQVFMKINSVRPQPLEGVTRETWVPTGSAQGRATHSFTHTYTHIHPARGQQYSFLKKRPNETTTLSLEPDKQRFQCLQSFLCNLRQVSELVNHMTHSLPFSRSLNRGHLLRETFPDHLRSSRSLCSPTSISRTALFSSIALSTT